MNPADTMRSFMAQVAKEPNPMETAPEDGTVIIGHIPRNGEGPEIDQAKIVWRDDERGHGWVLADDRDAYVYDPVGWLPDIQP